MTAPRKEDWVARLDRYFKATKSRAFAWGSHDCCTFTYGAVGEMTGEDPMTKYRRKYRTRNRAFAMAKRVGGGDLGALAEKFAATLGLKEIAPGFARRGDIVLFPTDDGPGMGVVDLTGRGIKGLHPERGLTHVPLTVATRAWRVGR